MCCRRIPLFNRSLLEGQWRGDTRFGIDPPNLTLGIIGLGGIGRKVSIWADNFHMTVQYCNRNPVLKEKNPADAKFVTLEVLLRTSDVISIHVPLNDTTRGMIGDGQIEMMKDGCVLINTARGPVVNEMALLKALNRGRLSCVGLDVFENEPYILEELRQHPHCILTPHIGSATVETQRAMEKLAAENVEMLVNHGKPKTPVPESMRLKDVKTVKWVWYKQWLSAFSRSPAS